jgi:2-polyprenyl-3-methyl-5-hydroxy-6-metoxy-1,4-benzoquinol methylase
MKKIRDHDKLYLKSNRYKKPKESHKLLYKILKKRISKNKNYELLDVGCANGELLYFLSQKFSNIKFYGADVRKDLINLAKKKLSQNIYLKQCDYNKKSLNKKFDIIICSGVISIFDKLDIFFKNIKNNLKKNSTLFLFSTFNEYDYDIMLSYKDMNSKIKNYQSGWNIWSLKTIKQNFKKKKITKYPFKIGFDVKKNKKDLVRVWTTKINKKRHFTNALLTILNQMWLEIR